MSDLLSKITWTNPLPVLGRITSVIGDARDYGAHEGIDIAVPAGTDILAAASGTVKRVAFMAGGYGNYVVLDHGNGIENTYAHMLSLSPLAEGERVNVGDVIGKVGSTGYSSGPHLHIGLTVNGVRHAITEVIDLGTAGVRGATQRALGKCDEYVSGGENAKELVLKWLECKGYSVDDEAAYDEYARRIEAGVSEGWLDEDGLPAGNSSSSSGNCRYSLGKLDAGALGSTELCLDSIVMPLETAVLNILFLPARGYINAFNLSNVKLVDGRDTFDWLKDSQNTAVLVSSVGVMILALILLVIALASFLRTPAEKVVQVGATVANPVGSAVEKVVEVGAKKAT